MEPQQQLTQKLSFWLGRATLYFVLTGVAFLLLFPLIYMVIASLKTTVDFNSNPRRLLPYTHVEESFAGQSVPLYTVEMNGESQEFLISQIDANNSDKSDFAYLGRQSDLEAQVKLGSHAEQRRNIEVLGIIPIAYRDGDGQKVNIDDQTLTLRRTDTTIELAGNDGVLRVFQVYDVILQNEPVLTYLESIDEQVPLKAYVLPSVAGANADTLTATVGEPVTLFDIRESDRDYDTVTLANGNDSETFVWAYNALIDVFIDQDDTQNVIYAIEAYVKPIEIIEFQLANYEAALGLSDEPSLRMDRALVNTAFVTILVTLGQMTTSLFGGYAFSRMHFRGRDALFLVYLGSIMVPFVVLIVPIYRLMTALGWEDHLVALIVPWIFTAYGTFLIRQFFITIPKELEEAALLDGCGRFRILWRIFIPLSTPALATHAIFTFLYAWNSFLWPLIIINTGNKDDQVLTLALITLGNINADKPNIVMTGAAVMILPPMIVFILAQRYFIEGIATSGLKG